MKRVGSLSPPPPPAGIAVTKRFAIIYFADTVLMGYMDQWASYLDVCPVPREFHNEEAAFAHLERMLWVDGPVCVHCGGTDRITKVKANPEKRIRLGLCRCGQCKSQFTVKVGTVLEHARMPLHKMLQAVYLITSSKKGGSAYQRHRML